MVEATDEDTRERIQVLLVEDNRWDAEVIQGFLGESSRYAFDAEWAVTLADGLRRLGEGDVEVVLLDLLLPDSFGLDTVDKVHRHAPNVALVVYSSVEDEAFEQDVLDRGAMAYLAKPRLTAAPPGHVNLVVRSVEYALEKNRLRSASNQPGA